MEKLSKRKANKIIKHCFGCGDWEDIFKAFAFKYPYLTRKLAEDFLRLK